MENLPTIPFSSNWNNKLDCKAFSTVRIRNDNKYKIGNEYTIILKEQPIFQATIVSITHFSLSALSPAMSYLDTGYSPKEQMKMLEQMYKNKNIAVYNIDWSFIVLIHKLLEESETTS